MIYLASRYGRLLYKICSWELVFLYFEDSARGLQISHNAVGCRSEENGSRYWSASELWGTSVRWHISCQCPGWFSLELLGKARRCFTFIVCCVPFSVSVFNQLFKSMILHSWCILFASFDGRLHCFECCVVGSAIPSQSGGSIRHLWFYFFSSSG